MDIAEKHGGKYTFIVQSNANITLNTIVIYIPNYSATYFDRNTDHCQALG
jgi:hypothetical protein